MNYMECLNFKENLSECKCTYLSRKRGGDAVNAYSIVEREANYLDGYFLRRLSKPMTAR